MTAALCGADNVDLSCGDEHGLKNQTDVITSNQTFFVNGQEQANRALGDSIHTYSLIHCHSWSKRNGIYDPQENSPSEIVNHVVFGTWERAPWKPRNRKQRHFYNSLMGNATPLVTVCVTVFFWHAFAIQYFSLRFIDLQ